MVRGPRCPGAHDAVGSAQRARFAHAGYRIPRLAFYLGRWIRGTDWWPDPQLRLFDRRRGRWQGGLIHESVRVEGSVVLFDAALQGLAGMLGDVASFARGRVSGRVDFSGPEVRSASGIVSSA